jgi:hypothetical protein
MCTTPCLSQLGVCILSTVNFANFFLLFGRQRRTSDTQAVLNTKRWQQAQFRQKIKEKDVKLSQKLKDMKRDKVMETVKEFPQEFDLEELIERLVFVEKVEKGLEQIKEGKTIPHEQVKDIIKKW